MLNLFPFFLAKVLPKQGLVYSERTGLSEELCKPKILPIKSTSLEKLEQMYRDATQAHLQKEGPK